MLKKPPQKKAGPWPEWLTSTIGQALAINGSGPVVSTLSGPPGSGKTTLAGQVRKHLASRGIQVKVLSLDDFYCTPRQRQVLAATCHPDLARRGLPGTHDLELLEDCISGLCQGQPVDLPRFDKALDDRLPGRGRRVYPIPDAILLEGWCLGVRPVDARAAGRAGMPVEVSGFVNTQIPRYQALVGRSHFFLQPPEWAAVAAWRAAQEHGIPNPCQRMGRAQVNEFLQWFRPFVCDMITRPPYPARVVRLDYRRRPATLETPCNRATSGMTTKPSAATPGAANRPSLQG